MSEGPSHREWISENSPLRGIRGELKAMKRFERVIIRDKEYCSGAENDFGYGYHCAELQLWRYMRRTLGRDYRLLRKCLQARG